MQNPQEFQDQYRKTIGLFATGVTVILTEKDGEVHGMTANAVTSLSLDPTLIIVCPSKSAHLESLLLEEVTFTVNILGDHQEALSNYFAAGTGDPEFNFEPWPIADKSPRLGGCIGALACRVYRRYEGGDHRIVVGEVLDTYIAEEPHWPLLYFGSGYHFPSRREATHLIPAADPYL